MPEPDIDKLDGVKLELAVARAAKFAKSRIYNGTVYYAAADGIVEAFCPLSDPADLAAVKRRLWEEGFGWTQWVNPRNVLGSAAACVWNSRGMTYRADMRPAVKDSPLRAEATALLRAALLAVRAKGEA